MFFSYSSFQTSSVYLFNLFKYFLGFVLFYLILSNFI